VAREVYDVTGAGDTVISALTLGLAAGATPAEAAVLSNHAAGLVIREVGTATVGAAELLESLREQA
jgi:D-beta-D-heptose 7-phosphate kinase/D-beta-D-heptose 1-phosphate adenosyltransferase